MNHILSISIFLLLVFRRIYLHYGSISLLPIYDLILFVSAVTRPLKIRGRRAFFDLMASSYLLISAIIGGIFIWQSNLDFVSTVENSYLYLYLILIPLYARGRIFYEIDSEKLFLHGILTAILVTSIQIFINGGHSIVVGDIYGWPNSTFFSSAVFIYGVFSEKHKMKFKILLIILAGFLMVLDQQRGAFLNVTILLILFLLFNSKGKFFKNIIKALALIVPLFLIVLLFDERSSGGFFLSIIYPDEYIVEYSSGADRLAQIIIYINAFSDWEHLLFGYGPSYAIIPTGWNDLHMGYISFIARYGLAAFLVTFFLLYDVIKYSIINVKTSFLSVIFLSILSDALTQTTFDSVPTSAIFILVTLILKSKLYRGGIINV
jgi:hypothetical protein